jgi:hypothetical protein
MGKTMKTVNRISAGAAKISAVFQPRWLRRDAENGRRCAVAVMTID